jgi:hypothetical protein
MKPHLQQEIGGSWLLWFKNSNRYAILAPNLKRSIDLYFKSSDEVDFSLRLEKQLSGLELNPESLYREIEAFLGASQIPLHSNIEARVKFDFDPSACPNAVDYLIKEVPFRVHYQSEETRSWIHYPIAHYSTAYKNIAPQAEFWIFVKNDVVHLFQDRILLQAVKRGRCHYIKGKFLTRLIGLIHNTEESEWTATLHASTVVSNETAILLAGQSGKGKSTLTALLLSEGFDLLADDITPLHASSQQVFYNPSAISIKKGAFPIVARHFNTFESCPEVFINTFKGTVKFLPHPQPPKTRYPSSAIVLVDYRENVDTQLLPVESGQVLQNLIPDSWISPDPRHAQAFMAWLDTLEFYQLTYSNSREAFSAIQSLTTK